MSKKPKKHFSMIFKSFLECQKVQDDSPEVWHVLECLSSPGMSHMLQNIFLWFLRLLECQKFPDVFPEVWHVLENPGSFKIFSNIIISLLDCQRSKIVFLKFDKSWNVFQAWQSLLSFYSFWKTFRTSKKSRNLLQIIQKYFQD